MVVVGGRVDTVDVILILTNSALSFGTCDFLEGLTANPKGC